jgi:hypothetical protein
MKGKQIVIGGIIAGIFIEVLSLAFSWFTQTVWDYNMVELAGMRSVEDPISILFFFYPWVLGFALAYVYSWFEDSLDGEYIEKGWKFGLLMWLVVNISSAFLVFSSMEYPIGFTVNSVFGSLIYMLVTGVFIAKIFDWL